MNETTTPRPDLDGASEVAGAPSAPAGTAARPARLPGFAEFDPVDLAEHANRTSRRLQFVGTTGVVACGIAAFATGAAGRFHRAVVCGEGFAWVGHFFFERNRPATFRHLIHRFIAPGRCGATWRADA